MSENWALNPVGSEVVDIPGSEDPLGTASAGVEQVVHNVVVQEERGMTMMEVKAAAFDRAERRNQPQKPRIAPESSGRLMVVDGDANKSDAAAAAAAGNAEMPAAVAAETLSG